MNATAYSEYKVTPGMVYFIGAGPGAPDLITVRGKSIISQADLILYADSLVSDSVAGLNGKPDTRIEGSSGMNLEQTHTLMLEAARNGKVVARVHSGDPTLYGAMYEQLVLLEDADIPYEIIPGVPSAFAAAALLKTELTVPDIVQTIILTRSGGRTSMPVGEELRALAAHGATLAIHLGITHIRPIVDELLASGSYTLDTSVAVLYKVSWPDEEVLIGTLADIAEKVRAAGFTRHALILVSPALDSSLKSADHRTSSHLYDKTYTHRFRKAVSGKGLKRASDREPNVPRQGIVVISVTRQGADLAATLACALNASLTVPTKFADRGSDCSIKPSAYADSVLAEIRRRWNRHRALVLVMPSGIAIRAIAPLLREKSSDPAVICVDEIGRSVIPLLGGHQARANHLAEQIATITGGYAAITTASDVQHLPALDLLGQASGWRIEPNNRRVLTRASASLVNGDKIGVYVDPLLILAHQQLKTWIEGVENFQFVGILAELEAYAVGLIVSHRLIDDHALLQKTVVYRPPALMVGIGCRRGVEVSELRLVLEKTLANARLSLESIGSLATAEIKADEPGLQILATEIGVPLHIIGHEQLQALDYADFSPSAATEKFDLPGVAEPCAMIAAGTSPGEGLLVPKTRFERCTVAVYLINQQIESLTQ